MPILELNQIPDAYKTPALTGELMGILNSSRLSLLNFKLNNITHNDFIDGDTIYGSDDNHVIDGRDVLTFLPCVNRLRT